MKNPGFLIGMVVGVILIYLLFAAFGMQDIGFVYGLVLSPLMGLAGRLIYTGSVGKIREMEERSYATYSFSNHALELKKRGKVIGRIVALEEILFSDYQYNDPKLVYTGATVGGVTTGGFHVEGGDYTEKLSRSRKFRLLYVMDAGVGNNKFDINRILLPDDLLEQVKNDSILSRYLKGNTLELFNDVKPDDAISKVARDSLASGNMAMAMTAAQRAGIDKFLDKETCAYIKRWLCGEI